MTPQELIASLKSLSEAQKEASALITRLSKLSPSPDTQVDEADDRVELSAEIHQSLKEQEEELELLKQGVEDLTSTGPWASTARRRDPAKEQERLTLVAQVERLDEDLKLARIQFRRAQLQAKRNADAAKRRERELLFSSIQEGHVAAPGKRKGQEKLSPDELLVNTSSDVTAALRRTHQLMQAELARSQFARDSLEQSTAALTTLNESYSTLSTLLSSSRSLISTLVSSQKSDTWYLETAFYILVGTIIWLVFRRIFWIPYKAILLMLRVTITAFTALLGAVTGSSGSIGSVARQASTSLIVKPSAQGGIPRFADGMAAPSIAVGGGGGGAKRGSGEDDSMVNRIGKMVDDSQEAGVGAGASAGEGAGVGAGVGAGDGAGTEGHADQGTVLRERRPDERPNPKKRMWEEPPPPGGQEEKERVRDEL